MRLFFYPYILVSVAYLSIGLITILNNSRENINRNFLSICLNLSFWAFMHAIMQLTDSAERASLYRQIMIFSWSALYVQIFYFTLFLTNHKHFFNKWYKNIVIMLLPIICYIFYMLTPTTAQDLLDTKWGWVYLLPNNRGFIWDQLFNIYYLIYMLMSITLIFLWKRKSTSKREIIQANIILLSFALVLLLGTITDVIFPMVGIVFVPPLAVIMIFFVILGMCYTIIKYKLMNITPESIMLDVFKNMKEGIVITDYHKKIISINQGAEIITGYTNNQLMNHSILTLFKQDLKDETYTSKEMDIQSASGNSVHLLVSKSYQYDQFDKVLGTVYTFQDITLIKAMQRELEEAREKLEVKVHERTEALSKTNIKLKNEIQVRMEKEEEINRLIYNDYLTNLPNRRYLNLRLKQSIENAKISQTKIAILFLDLDNFKMVNDTMGHDAGDELLKQVSQRLVNTLRENDCISRVGGDEFIVLLENVKSERAIEKVCEKIIQMFQMEFNIHDIPTYIMTSIGISVYPDDGENIDLILENADIAMYSVKSKAKHDYQRYDASMRIGLDEVMYLTNELYKAGDFSDFEIFYQPQIDSTTNQIFGFEALVRWNHPENGLLTPDRFIHLGEKTGLIIPLGEWIIKSVLNQIRLWAPFFNMDFKVGINLSPNQLMHPKFSERLDQIWHDYDLPPQWIEFEVTEGIFMNDSEIIKSNLKYIKEKGFSIAIDDFGTEYASLNYLKFLPLDRIKIPKEFVDGIGLYKEDEAIINSIIALSKSLDCHVIAEGVELPSQIEYLQENGCEMIQGYFYYRPMTVDDIENEFFTEEQVAGQ